jgi:hypothetical protein
MDLDRLDSLARRLAAGATRRHVLGALAAAPVLGGLVTRLDPEDAEARKRRARRKDRRRRRKHKAEDTRRRKQHRRGCTPKKRDVVCAGRCGEVQNRQTCGKPVDCGSCDCSPPCGECFTCQGNGDAPGTCVPTAGAPCGAAQTCQDGVLQPQESCSSAGVCEAASPVSCAPYLHCAGNACATSCASDADCVADAFCLGGQCVGDGADGSACTHGGQCASGYCVENICCNSACAGECVACDLAGKAGTCTPRDSGTPCGPAATCSAGTEHPQGACNGSGTCEEATPVSCAPYRCADATTCATSCVDNEDCSENALCADGTCHACDVTEGDDLGAAIGDADDDEVLFVCPGTYAGGFTIAKSLTLIGAGAGQTLLDGEGNRRVLNVSGDVPVTLQALTITGGSGSSGGGIFNTSALTLVDAELTANTASGNTGSTDGGGAIWSNNALTLRNTHVHGNTSMQFGGGIYIDGGPLILEEDSRIEENTAMANGGGIYGYADITLQGGSRISGNHAGLVGGGVALESGTLTLRSGSQMTGNEATYGGALDNYGGTVKIKNDVLICGNIGDPQCRGDVTGPGACPSTLSGDCPA